MTAGTQSTRRVTGLLVFLGAVAASFLVPPPEAPPPADPVPTATLTGIVTLHGFPVVARIEVRRIRDLARDDCVGREWTHPFRNIHEPVVGSGDPVGTAESDADGRFRIGGLPVAVYHVTARTPTGATDQWTLDVVGPGETLRERFCIISTGRSHLGRLRWSDGRPFVGQVSLGHRGTETSPDGRFALADLPRYEFPIRAHVPGSFSRIVGYYDPEGADRIDIVVDEGLVRREGRVVAADDGRPLEGVFVGAFWREEPRRQGGSATLTGPDGTFRILAKSGNSRIAAAGEDHQQRWVRDEESGPPAVIRLRPRPIVTGRVVTPDGRPLSGAPLWLLHLPASGPSRPGHQWRAPVLTDARGHFRFTSTVTGFAVVAVYGGGLLSGGLSMVHPNGYHPLAVHLVAGETVELELVAEPSPSIVGRVTDPAGRPVAGMRVYAAESPAQPQRPTGRGGYPGTDAPALTGPDGAYRIETVVPGWWRHAQGTRSHEESVNSDPVWPEGEVEVDLVLPAPPSRWVDVEVLSAEDGRPVAGATVREELQGDREDGPFDGTGRAGMTGPDGRTRLGPFAEGLIILSVDHPEHRPETGVPLQLEPGEPPAATIAIRLQPGAVLGGCVRTPDGSPAAFSGVFIGRRFEFADASGRFTVRDLKAGVYDVSAWAAYSPRRYESATVRVRTGRRDLVLSLIEPPPPGPREPRDSPVPPPPPGRIAGVVRDEFGVPVRGAQVSLSSDDPGARYTDLRVWTDAAGRFSLRATQAVLHRVHVVGPSHLFLRSVVSAVADDERVEVRLAAAARPVITVLDSAGNPVPRVVVELVGSEDGRRSPGPDQRLITDPRGRVRLGGLDPERAVGITLTPPEDRDDLAATKLTNWTPADRTIRLRTGEPAHLTPKPEDD